MDVHQTRTLDLSLMTCVPIVKVDYGVSNTSSNAIQNLARLKQIVIACTAHKACYLPQL